MKTKNKWIGSSICLLLFLQCIFFMLSPLPAHAKCDSLKCVANCGNDYFWGGCKKIKGIGQEAVSLCSTVEAESDCGTCICKKDDAGKCGCLP